MSALKTKSINFEAKAVDDKTGTFSGYCSVFGNEDSYGDVVMPGAFKDTIQAWTDRGKMPPILWQHDTSVIIGIWTKLAEDDTGLYGEGVLFIDDIPKAREALALMKYDAIDGLSIGYRLQKWSYNEDDAVLELLAIDLKEISVVTFPANDESRIDAVKNILDAGELPTLPQFEKFLREAGFSKTQATGIAGHGLRGLMRGDPGQQKNEDTTASDVLAILNNI